RLHAPVENQHAALPADREERATASLQVRGVRRRVLLHRSAREIGGARRMGGGRAPSRLARLTIVIPARDEEACIAATVEHLAADLRLHDVPHEIIVVDDGSRDRTYAILVDLKNRIPELRPLQNSGPHGFGRAIVFGLDRMSGDAVVIMMADESDDHRDVVRYWQALNAGWDCVFGSRFI